MGGNGEEGRIRGILLQRIWYCEWKYQKGRDRYNKRRWWGRGWGVEHVKGTTAEEGETVSTNRIMGTFEFPRFGYFFETKPKVPDIIVPADAPVIVA